MANKFKVGDRVRRTVDDGEMAPRNFKAGFETTVAKVVESSVVDVDGFYHSRDNIELIQPATTAIRTVTRREIVPGVYGMIEIRRDAGLRVITNTCFVQSEDLREAANLFNQIAEVLEENAALEMKEAA